ncbi:helix-hairpin-helix domain-containing protein [Streptomyces sp. H27-C3]|uniref:helix-hairpin-helix domain-containing protein n=1 Tax=Streptomyces sp. H27-C3 TaxID=3046305 RepID=UPI0024B92704|nr:helix-hairpin-helix domain-containing protein [Streptomyces sp. H27-C3]MDJ0460398.1 helix-hairpin-helix domain-containing protein [Streptomyces sp. H27-C3]
MAELVDINTAPAQELAKLPGVGETIAGSVIAHRDKHGPFDSVEGLLRVPGVTEHLLARLRRLVTVGTPPGRPPASETVDVQLTDPSGTGDFTGHSVSVTGVRATGQEATGDVPFATSGPTGADGLVTLSLPARATLAGDVAFQAHAPDGELLAGTSHAGASLPRTVKLTVAAREPGTTVANDDPAAGRPSRVRGRVIDSAGHRQAAGLQVVLWGAENPNPQPPDFRALTVSTTDAQGHFTGPYPLGPFTAAHATVGLEDQVVTVPVHLEGQGAFPERVLLVVDLPEPLAEDDCSCHDPGTAPRSPDATDLARADGTFSTDAGMGRCVDFTKPDRTLEEYSFTYLVRTTEPEIKGLELDEPSKVPGYRLDAFVKGEVYQPVTGFQPGDPGGPARVTAPMSARVDVVGTPSEADVRDEAVPSITGFIDAAALKNLTRNPGASRLKAVYAADRLTRHGDLQRYLGGVVAKPPGRRRLTAGTPVDWDDDPTVHQASTIAHGHILRFKQEWVADGYSMGNLLYSLPLAPGQKKQIAVVDWERRETTAREELRESHDSLEASLTRDRDISEIVSGTLSESMRGGSHSSAGAIAAGIGIGAIIEPVAGLLGVGGGHSSADSSAWQDSSRSTAANALNQLRDRTVQAASSVRTQRTSVVHTVAQGERVVATTESVANYNHCHALTIQYFEVLRHLLVRERLVDVQECLLVPLLMSWFTDDKALRWRNTLASAVPRSLRGGFDALDRIDAGYAGSDLPLGRYADENLESVEGELNLRFQLARPRDKDEAFDPAAWAPLLGLFGFTPQDFYDQNLKGQQFKDRVFLEQLGPKIASSVVQHLRVKAIKNDESIVDLSVDPTLVSGFVNDASLFVSLRMAASLPPVKRSDIKAVVVSSRLELFGLPFVIDLLPAGSRVVVDSGSLRYRTAHLSSALFTSSFIRNDLTGYDDVRIETPLSRRELRNPREEDKELARNLLDHLNENIERYHHILWSRMSDARRFMLLDGFEAPNSGGRSVASVVENELIGIVGNSLVLPVARGFHLDPTYTQDAQDPIDLLEHYQPNTPIEPSRIAVPTSGVYAEAVMGACNSCEEMDENRFWRWEESPIPDSPPQILPASTDTRRATPSEVTPTDFPQPIIAMQNAPAAPDPTGVGAALTLLGQSGAFRDLAGLEGTQKNAAAALEQAFTTATAFGTKAADLALQAKMSKDIDKALKAIKSAKAEGLIDDKEASELTSTALRGMVGAGTTNPESSTSTKEVKEITDTAGENQASVKVTRPTGEQVDVDARPVMPGASPPHDAGVPPAAGVPQAPVEIAITGGTHTLDPLGGGPPAEFVFTIKDLSAITADKVTLTINDTLNTVYEEVLPQSFLSSGRHVWRWNGRNTSGGFDGDSLRHQLSLMLTFEYQGQTTIDKLVTLDSRPARGWTSSRVDTAGKKVAVDVYVDCQNEDDLPQATYEKLRGLVLSGIGKYWSRSVTLGSDTYVVTTTAHQRNYASEDLDLYIENGSGFRRSHNSGLVDASIFYNKGFHGGMTAKADQEFEKTAAHEFGHSVLEAWGGKALSWGHKGTVNANPLKFWNFQDFSSSATPHPTTGEIDLMKYYTDAGPADFHSRVVAANEDVLRLIGVTGVTLRMP